MDTEAFGQQVNPGTIEDQASGGNRRVTKHLAVNCLVSRGKAPMPAEKEIHQGSEKSASRRRGDVPNPADLDEEYQ